ncbi:MAG: class I SAM-dependent methyltransferase [Pseudomonadota bacterium]
MQTDMAAAALTENRAAEVFLERACGIIDAGAQAVMLSLGHRTGLFDAMAGHPPSTSAEIAERAGLAERYVREWLAVMVTAAIVAFEPKAGRYHLPDAHAACLTRDAPLGNVAVYAQTVAMIGAAEERLQQCFATGEGTTYADYPCFHAFMAEDSGQTVVAHLFDVLLPLVDGLTARLAAGIDVLDAGCGRGQALIAMAEAFPASRFTGYDLCDDAIQDARHAAAGVDNLRFFTKDLSNFDEQERYDLVTSFDAVHDQKDPAGLVAGIHGALRSGGVYLMQDIGGSAHLQNNLDFPMASLLYAISCAHCTPVSIGQGGEGLGTMWGWETADAMLRGGGFGSVERHVLPHDPMNVWFVARRDAA